MNDIQPGAWVQYTDPEIRDQMPDGKIYRAAERGDVAHVLSGTDKPDWFDLFFERTGSIQTCHVSEFKLLGPASTGRAP